MLKSWQGRKPWQKFADPRFQKDEINKAVEIIDAIIHTTPTAQNRYIACLKKLRYELLYFDNNFTEKQLLKTQQIVQAVKAKNTMKKEGDDFNTHLDRLILDILQARNARSAALRAHNEAEAARRALERHEGLGKTISAETKASKLSDFRLI